MRPELTLLDHSGEEVGRLQPNGLAGASLDAGDLTVRIERADRRGTEQSGYRMLVDGETPASSGPLAESMALSCGGETYEVRASPLRNTASARLSGEGEGSRRETARVEGNVWGRRYRVSVDARDERALPVAIFLLYQTVCLRSRAYRASAR